MRWRNSRLLLKKFSKENEIDDSQLKEYRSELKKYYTRDFTKEYKRQNNGRSPDIDKYFDQLDDDSALLQYFLHTDQMIMY